MIKDKIIIECNNLCSNRNTNSYLNVYTNLNVDMKKLSQKKVFIIGLGGIGCEMITHLLGVGIKNFVILDFDRVDATNLNRQYLYDNNDISKNKVEAVMKKIKDKNPSAKVSVYNKFIDDYSDVKNIIEKENVDIVVCAADTPFPDIRIFILKACILSNVPCVFGGVSILTGQYGPTFISTKKMKLYLAKLNELKKKVEGNNTNKSSFGPTNTIIAAYIAIDVIMVLINAKKNINSLNKIKTLNFITRNDYEEKKLRLFYNKFYPNYEISLLIKKELEKKNYKVKLVGINYDEFKELYDYDLKLVLNYFEYIDNLYFYSSNYFKYIMKKNRKYKFLLNKLNSNIFLNALNYTFKNKWIKEPLISFYSCYKSNKYTENFSYLECNYDRINSKY